MDLEAERDRKLVEAGYKVRPTQNGGFIVSKLPVYEGMLSVEFAFSDARDLLHFLSQEHGVVGLDLITAPEQPQTPSEGEDSTETADAVFNPAIGKKPLPADFGEPAGLINPADTIEVYRDNGSAEQE